MDGLTDGQANGTVRCGEQGRGVRRCSGGANKSCTRARRTSLTPSQMSNVELHNSSQRRRRRRQQKQQVERSSSSSGSSAQRLSWAESARQRCRRRCRLRRALFVFCTCRFPSLSLRLSVCQYVCLSLCVCIVVVSSLLCFVYKQKTSKKEDLLRQTEHFIPYAIETQCQLYVYYYTVIKCICSYINKNIAILNNSIYSLNKSEQENNSDKSREGFF